MIGELIKAWRDKYRLGVRSAAKSIGVSAATISRIERGKQIDAETMLKLVNWLFMVERKQ